MSFSHPFFTRIESASHLERDFAWQQGLESAAHLCCRQAQVFMPGLDVKCLLLFFVSLVASRCPSCVFLLELDRTGRLAESGPAKKRRTVACPAHTTDF